MKASRFLRGNKARTKRENGFTLIELLIVIAIILILIAIALPNFLEAQIRAKVTKTKGEMRSIVTSLEAYFLDFGIYPPETENNCLQRGSGRPISSCGLLRLTSPIAYMTSMPEDPFPGPGVGDEITIYETGGVEDRSREGGMFNGSCLVTYVIFSRGPDGIEDVQSADPQFANYDGSVDTYGPTNGTRSGGDIFHYGGDSTYIGTTCSGKSIACARDPSKIGNGGLGLVVDHQSYLHRLPPGLF